MREARVSPTRSLGQHFLSDYGFVNRIVAAAELSADDVVVEVGPGLGVLTQKLAQTTGKVVAIEIDAKLAERLREQLKDEANVIVVQGDALTVEPRSLLEAADVTPETPYVVVANLPYNAGTAIVRRFLEASRPPKRMVVMLQREVAASMTAPAGETGLLGVSVQVYANAKRLFNVPPRAFYPPPRVVSSVVRLDVRPEPIVPIEERDRFFRVVRAGFSAPRKQLRNTLAQGLGLPPSEAARIIEAAGLEPTLRPQQLRLEDWLGLSREVAT
ncbi:MAG TPA: 16S rRNA (adenine(1518)-N(6)/adenine(1519)-N(6))-dimethyltransferase RsmA [Dehalococcoidia bacterium]|nr:16S rRNA (adenine(1518)-N(6)/adenine(1519)-N(6))-dimethyltransferase RsmA [Dehalococcoidia bacterium]